MSKIGGENDLRIVAPAPAVDGSHPAVSVRTYRNYIIVPVLDEATGLLCYWDVHEPCRERAHKAPEGRCDCPSSTDPIGTVATLAEAEELVRDEVSFERHLKALEGSFRQPYP